MDGGTSHDTGSPYPFRMTMMMAPRRIIRTMSPPAQIPRIRPISSECCDTSRGRLLSLQAAARGQGQAGRVKAQLQRGWQHQTGERWDSSHGMHIAPLTHFIPLRRYRALQCHTMSMGESPSRFPWGETVPLCHFSSRPM